MPEVHSSMGSKRHFLGNQQKRFAREHFAFAREEKRFAREHFTFAREEKRFAREHFTFAREEKGFACEHFTFAREEKGFACEHFAFAREEKRFAREHFAFAREQKRFPRCRRSGVVFPRSVHPPSDSGVAKRDRPPAVSLQKEQLFKKFQERCIFRPLSRVLWVEGCTVFGCCSHLAVLSFGVPVASKSSSTCFSMKYPFFLV